MNEIASDCAVPYIFEDDCDCAAEGSDINVTEEESAWTHTTITCLLEECLKKKKDLHDPRHRRNKFFGEIHERMIERGFLFSVKSLERKFHSLKKNFSGICYNRDRSNAPGRPITWPYYQKMMEIFAEELEIEDAPTMASLYPDPPLPKNAVVALPVIEPKLEPEPLTDGETDLVDDEHDGDEESPWNHKAVLAFLQECCRKKHELWDPQVRRRKIFTDIRHRLKARGYRFFQESLDRKLRNMKKHFQVVTEAEQKNIGVTPKRRRITWPYYEQLKEIYGEELEKDVNRRKKSQLHSSPSNQSLRTLKFRPITAKPGETPENLEILVSLPVVRQEGGAEEKFDASATRKTDENPTSPGEFDRFNSQKDDLSMDPSAQWNESNMCPSPAYNDQTLGNYELNLQAETKPNCVPDRLKFSLDLLALEERRTIVAEGMVEEIIQSNKIREKRLEFNRIKLEYVTAKAKRKKNGSLDQN